MKSVSARGKPGNFGTAFLCKKTAARSSGRWPSVPLRCGDKALLSAFNKAGVDASVSDGEDLANRSFAVMLTQGGFSQLAKPALLLGSSSGVFLVRERCFARPALPWP